MNTSSNISSSSSSSITIPEAVLGMSAARLRYDTRALLASARWRTPAPTTHTCDSGKREPHQLRWGQRLRVQSVCVWVGVSS